MDETLAALRVQQAELASYVTDRGHDDLLVGSRCPRWTVADVLLHLAQTNEMAVASVQGRLGELSADLVAGLGPVSSVDELAGAMVELQRGDPVATRDRWLASAHAQAEAFATCDPSSRVEWVAGQMAARTLASTRLTETWIHTVDVAVAYGPAPEPTDRLWHTARLAWRTVPYALAQAERDQHGAVAFELTGPRGDTWVFGDPAADPTVVRGTAIDLCTVAGQRADAADTALSATGPDADAVLELVRTFA